MKNGRIITEKDTLQHSQNEILDFVKKIRRFKICEKHVMNSLKDIDEVLAYWAHIWHDGGHTPFLFWNAVVLGEHLVYNCQSDAKAKNQGT